MNRLALALETAGVLFGPAVVLLVAMWLGERRK